MATNKIACRSGRTLLVDPNQFDGQSSLSNISVPNEDLNILVELTTSRKARTILTTEKEGDSTVNRTKSTGDISVSFIEGSDVSGQKVLTTKFTDLTTSFESGSVGENLGITNIDIDFTSSYAPQITINFIDVRGSAIFQDEKGLSEATSKYSVFFQLPYPIYSLTVKGYYGKPVKYCLHMTSFNSRFNSQTGNFEITAKFIGYTYAMLTDMLIGYLKAIPYTDLGKARFEKIKQANNGQLLTLDELTQKTSNINSLAKKIKSSDPNSTQLALFEQKKSILDSIKLSLFNLGSTIDSVRKDLETYPYAVITTSNATSNNFLIPSVPNALSLPLTTITNSSPENNEATDKYQTDVSNELIEYNGNNNPIPLSLDVFKKVRYYQGLTLNILNNPSNDFIAKTILGEQADYIQKKTDIYEYLKKNYNGKLQADQKFDICDLTDKYSALDKAAKDIDSSSNKLTIALGNTLKSEVSKAIGFDPTIRNIIKIFSAHVEVFLGVIHDVASSASINTKRTTELKTKFNGGGDSNNQTYDIKSKAIAPTTGNAAGPLSDVFYPWPEYRKPDDTNGIIEAYLGEVGTLTHPENVDELNFINDLLKAFLTSGKINQEISTNIGGEETSWYPVNPVDTRFFTSTSPYKRFNGFPKSDLMAIIMMRAMAYLGYSNKGLTVDEIQSMADIEASSVLNNITNDLVLKSLTQVTIDEFINAVGSISYESGAAKNNKVIKKLGTQFYYDYIIDSDKVSPDNTKIIPISDTFTGDWPVFNSELIDKANAGSVFLTNYGTTTLGVDKFDNGSTFIKIISPSDYVKNSRTLVSGPTPNDGTLDLSKLKLSTLPLKGAGVGFNPFGGAYGIQEFTKLNYGKPELDGLPFRFMFYDDANFDNNVYNKSNGLGLKRAASSKINGTTPTTPYDIGKDSATYVILSLDYSLSEIIDGTNSDKTIRKFYGKNRLLAKNYLQGNRDVAYPFINFQVYSEDATDGKNLLPVSLFGSRFYYEQRLTGGTENKYAKALLFLHTLPWNGLIKNTDRLWNFSTDETIFSRPEILNTFGFRAGFISVPKLWATFIGAMLWRADSSAPILDYNQRQIDGGSGPSDPIIFNNGTDYFIPTFSNSSLIPTRTQYLTIQERAITELGKASPDCQMSFDGLGISARFGFSVKYKEFDQLLLTLPDQAKKELKTLFFNFVQSSDLGSQSDWDLIRADLEVFNGTSSQWISKYNSVMGAVVDGPAGAPQRVVPTATVRGLYNNFDNYIIFSPQPISTDFKNNFILELKDDAQVNKTLIDKFCEETYIMNTTYKIWGGNDSTNTSPTDGIFVDETDLNIYIQELINKFTQNKDALIGNNKTKQLEQNIFGTADENIIKFQLYRTCKNIYDKWVGGSATDDIIFQCGDRNNIDSELAIKSRGNGATPSLIDSFRFVTRSFKDIGDELIINPLPVNEILLNNVNSSFYDVISRILTANNFDFIALPSYINYNDPNELSNLFTPYSYRDAIKDGVSGPSFVCVYVGQTSKNLDFSNSDYPNDGFDVRCDSNGNMIGNIPKDFSNDTNAGENNVAVFAVNYGIQNQNIFKDISLDQGEFTETAESLQITDDISKNGSENNRAFAGQNIFNVYSVRSYKVEVEAMGNAMIQPMMYFQLNNIPMFHGAYMITRVKHSIRPNYMSTVFSGVRIRKPETPLIDVSVLYMSMLDSMGAADVQASTSFSSTSVTTTNSNNNINTVASLDDLKNRISGTNFDIYKNQKYTQYGNA